MVSREGSTQFEDRITKSPEQVQQSQDRVEKALRENESFIVNAKLKWGNESLDGSIGRHIDWCITKVKRV